MKILIIVFSVLIPIWLYNYHAEREKKLRLKLQLQERIRIEALKETIPCAICGTLPNTPIHLCTVEVRIERFDLGKKREPRSRYYSYDARQSDDFGRKVHYEDTLLDQKGRLKRCERRHKNLHEAKTCGDQSKRGLQTGEFGLVLTSVSRKYKPTTQTPRTAIQGLNQNTWAAIVVKHNFQCVYCGVSGDVKTFHKEHKIPLARGGENSISNIVPACAACNLDKKTLTDIEYIQWRADRAEYAKLESDVPQPGNPLRPKVDNLQPNQKKVVAPRGSTKAGWFYKFEIDAMFELLENSKDKTSANRTAELKPGFLEMFRARKLNYVTQECNGEKPIISAERLIPNKKGQRRKNYGRRSASNNRHYSFCGRLSENEVRGLKVAADRGSNHEITLEDGSKIGVVKIEKFYWEEDLSDASHFHLYRLPTKAVLKENAKKKSKNRRR